MDKENELKKIYKEHKLNKYIKYDDLLECFKYEGIIGQFSVNTRKLIRLRIYDVFEPIFREFSPGKGEGKYLSSHDMEREIETLVKIKGNIDYRFVRLFDLENDNRNEKKNQLLCYFRNGKLEWSSKTILDLINLGGVCISLSGAGGSMPNSYEKDIFTTNLIKDYCERHIDE